MKSVLRRTMAVGLIFVLQLATPPAVQSAFADDRPSQEASPAPGKSAATTSNSNARDTLVRQLIAKDASPEDAKPVVASLSDEDVAVLAANPAMLDTAGADSGDIALTIILVLVALAIIGAAAAA